METARPDTAHGEAEHHTSIDFTLEEIKAELAQLRKERAAQKEGRWNIVEATKVCDLSAPHLSRLCRTERLDAVLIDGAWYIEPSSLLKWVKRQ